ncbi:hypothetical protein R1sor_022116 [Riccia sorocarpa]|uniref:Uncharacterized protein n=1 Tax=Riccia sorocarpa TaxID=122646 RepID=A0ABD3GM37_9MARC
MVSQQHFLNFGYASSQARVTVLLLHYSLPALPREEGSGDALPANCKDFVDLLLSFLTLPMGCIVKLLSGPPLLPSQATNSVGLTSSIPQTAGKNLHGKACTGIASIHESVVQMEDSLLQVDKGLLLDALPQVPPVCFKLLPFSSRKDARKDVNYYCCGVSCNFLTRRSRFKCPRHKRKMTTLSCQVLESERQNPEGQADSAVGQRCHLRGVLPGSKAFGVPVCHHRQVGNSSKLRRQRTCELEAAPI